MIFLTLITRQIRLGIFLDILLFTFTTLFMAVNLHAADPGPKSESEPVSGYLGMAVDRVPEGVRAHLPNDIAETQGLLVTRFADESPAADDGIKLYDVLITYDGQPIDAPELFIQKVRMDKPGRKATFKLVRQGVIISVLVTIGEQVRGQKNMTNTQVNQAQVQPLTASATTVPIPVLNANKQAYSNQHPVYPGYYQKRNPNVRPFNRTYSNQSNPVNPSYYAYPNRNGFPMSAPYYNKPYNVPQRVQPSTPVLNVIGKPSFPMRQKIVKEKKAWGDKRNIWPDFYTGSTGDMWDSMMNAPFDMGRMPGGWRAPSLSTPDPVTVGDAVGNQIPPIVEEMGNMADFTN